MRLRTIAFAATMLVGCTDEGASRRALESHGFTNIRFTGYTPMACAHDDDFSTGFVATNPKGESVRGVVCCGVVKSCTVRF